MQPDTLSSRIEKYRAWFARYMATGVAIAPEAMVACDALFAEFVKDARDLEARLDAPPLPLARVVAELDAETRATEAMTASMARTKLRLVDMRAAQDRAARLAADEAAVLDGVRAGKVALFPPRDRRFGDVSVETALGVIGDMLRDAPKSRFDDAPTFDNEGDCA